MLPQNTQVLWTSRGDTTDKTKWPGRKGTHCPVGIILGYPIGTPLITVVRWRICELIPHWVNILANLNSHHDFHFTSLPNTSVWSILKATAFCSSMLWRLPSSAHVKWYIGKMPSLYAPNRKMFSVKVCITPFSTLHVKSTGLKVCWWLKTMFLF